MSCTDRRVGRTATSAEEQLLLVHVNFEVMFDHFLIFFYVLGKETQVSAEDSLHGRGIYFEQFLLDFLIGTNCRAHIGAKTGTSLIFVMPGL